jgi:hypothetical protein
MLNMVIKKAAPSSILFPILIFLLSFITLSIKARVNYISPYDEMYHLSYIQYLFQGSIPRYGDPTNSWSLNGFSCHKVFPFGVTTSIPCGEIGVPSLYPEGGTNSAQGWPPGYYAIAALFFHLFSALPLEPIYLGRYVSIFLWSIGCVGIYFLQLRANFNHFVAASISLAAASLPFAIIHGSFISPHSTVPLVVTLLGWSAFSVIGGKPSIFLDKGLAIVLVPLIGLLILPQALPIVIAVAAFHMINDFMFSRNSEGKVRNFPHQFLRLASVPIAASSTVVWSRIQEARRVDFVSGIDATAAQQPSDPGLNLVQIYEALFRFFPNATDQYQFLSPTGAFVSKSWSFLLIGVVAFLIIQSYSSALRILGLSLLVSSMLFGVFSEILIPVAVSPRYGLSVILFAMACLGLILRDNFARCLVVAICVFTYLVGLTLAPFYGTIG